MSQHPAPSRPPMVFGKLPGAVGQAQGTCNKTKSAICFMCLFDGLRNPSIRRLVRKPRTVCQRPLLTFDPTYYAPQSKHSVHDIYKNSINCPCDFTVDPSAQNVMSLLRKHVSSMPPQRVLLHYFGHGVHPPTDDGALYFFSEDRTRYKPIKAITILSACPCPLCVIIDAPNAGCLVRFFQSKHDSFFFFSCAANETLPMSTDAPLDLFSSCLLTPYDAALWFHRRHHSNVHEMEDCAAVRNKNTIHRFLETILSAILFDSQPPATYEKFNNDPSVFSLTRGFVLAQRIYNSFNLHPTTTPDLKNMSNHDLWGMWDIALDCFLTMPIDRAMSTVFTLFSKSFANFPSAHTLPIFSFFMKSEFHRDAENQVLNFIDNTEGAASICARSNIPSIIAQMEKPTVNALLILAKTIAAEKITPFDSMSTISFHQSRDPEVLKAGFLTLILSMQLSSLNSFQKLINVAIDRANVCAPYSAYFLGMLLERASKLMSIPEWFSKFSPLLKSRRADVRAAVCYVLGYAHESEAAQLVSTLFTDTNAVVRCQSVWTMTKLINEHEDFVSKEIVESLVALQNDADQYVRESVQALLPFITKRADNQQMPQDNILIQRLLCNVKGNSFHDRFETDAFLCENQCC